MSINLLRPRPNRPAGTRNDQLKVHSRTAVAGDLHCRKLSQPVNCDLIVRLQRNRTYKLSGAIHQIDPGCVLHPVAAFFELDAQGEYLLAGSGESAYARVE